MANKRGQQDPRVMSKLFVMGVTLDEMASFGPDHLSVYGRLYKEGKTFAMIANQLGVDLAFVRKRFWNIAECIAENKKEAKP